MKRLMIKDLSLTEELRRAPMGAVRGGFCGTPVPEPVVTLPAFPAMPAMPAMPCFARTTWVAGSWVATGAAHPVLRGAVVGESNAATRIGN